MQLDLPQLALAHGLLSIQILFMFMLLKWAVNFRRVCVKSVCLYEVMGPKLLCPLGMTGRHNSFASALSLVTIKAPQGCSFLSFMLPFMHFVMKALSVFWLLFQERFCFANVLLWWLFPRALSSLSKNNVLVCWVCNFRMNYDLRCESV